MLIQTQPFSSHGTWDNAGSERRLACGPDTIDTSFQGVSIEVNAATRLQSSESTAGAGRAGAVGRRPWVGHSHDLEEMGVQMSRQA